MSATLLRWPADVAPDQAAGLLQPLLSALASGQVVVVPTETVYGVAARLDSPLSIETLFAVKGRDRDKPLQVLVADSAAAAALAIWDDGAQRIADACWPGPLTLVLPTAEVVPAAVRAADGTVGLRCPDHPLLQRLLALSGPLAASSANLAGEPPATDGAAAWTALGGVPGVGVVLDHGPAPGGQASTVARWRDGRLDVLRVGPISADALQSALADTAG